LSVPQNPNHGSPAADESSPSPDSPGRSQPRSSLAPPILISARLLAIFRLAIFFPTAFLADRVLYRQSVRFSFLFCWSSSFPITHSHSVMNI
jgi:hypothetical protein